VRPAERFGVSWSSNRQCGDLGRVFVRDRMASDWARRWIRTSALGVMFASIISMEGVSRRPRLRVVVYAVNLRRMRRTYVSCAQSALFRRPSDCAGRPDCAFPSRRGHRMRLSVECAFPHLGKRRATSRKSAVWDSDSRKRHTLYVGSHGKAHSAYAPHQKTRSACEQSRVAWAGRRRRG